MSDRMSEPQAHPTHLAGYEARAWEVLGDAARAYFLEGAGQQITSSRNIADLAAVTVLTRVLRDLKGGGTSCTLLGKTRETPILVAPMAYQSVLHPDAEAGVAAAATAQGCGMVLSAQASQPMEQVRGAGENCGWMQLYWQPTKEANLALAKRAADCGFEALVLTVDAPVQGIRDAEIAVGFQLPATVRPVNLDGLPQARFAPLRPDESMIFDRIAHILPTWDDVAWLAAQGPLPVLLKGILHPQDARLAMDSGAAGIIVSNHGGRVLDGGPSTISVLPAIADAIDGRLPVLMDGGIRRGVDILKALALGADAVLVGRPVCHGLAVAGAQGVSHVLRLLREELEVAMALSGCAHLSEITRDRVNLPGDLTLRF